MMPILLQSGVFTIYTFGFFLLIAFLTGSFLLWRNIKLTSYKETDIFDMLFISIFAGLFTSRLVYAVLNFDEIGFSVLRFILINGYPGMSLFGALLGAFLCLFIYAKFKKISFLELSEYIMSPLLLSFSIAKIGSFLSGIDLGKKTDFILQMHYLGVEGGRHFVGLYESLLLFIGFIITYRLMFIVRREKAASGTSFYFFLVWFGLVQLILDNLKENHLYLAEFSLNGVAGGILCIVGTVFLLTRYRSRIVVKLKKNLKKNGNKTHKKRFADSEGNASEGGDESEQNNNSS